ncbi:hypothetical protein KSX_43300 [Ktedonospora formicarum]|uniref:Uncharacterized protein n=1 Tax=Ktedonospora formicarum TaxID=2778364 RepID=A0A8J3MRK6_9CHLR|nr:hypothetical protein KSX_43300 [Ktedonospora formicarum]
MRNDQSFLMYYLTQEAHFVGRILLNIPDYSLPNLTIHAGTVTMQGVMTVCKAWNRSLAFPVPQ